MLVLMLLLLAGGGWYWSRTLPGTVATSAIPTGPGDVYVALGDSLAAGFIVSNPQHSYVPRIAQALRQHNPEIETRNFAVGGETSRSLLLRQLPQAIRFIEEQRAAGRRVSPITITIGGNDALPAANGLLEVRRRTIETIEANIGVALDQLITATTDRSGQRTADIAIMTYYNLFPGDPDDQQGVTYWANQLNAAIDRVARERGVAVADVAGAFDEGKIYRYTYIASGDIHANDAGHAVIAEEFLKALEYTP